MPAKKGYSKHSGMRASKSANNRSFGAKGMTSRKKAKH